MDAFMEILGRGFDQLLGRGSGPLHLRLLITPTVAAILAIRAGIKDARAGRSPFLLANQAERRELFRSGWKDIGRVFVLALVLDATYQLVVFRAFYVVQALLVALFLAIVPFALFRGVVTGLMRRSHSVSHSSETREDQPQQALAADVAAEVGTAGLGEVAVKDQ